LITSFFKNGVMPFFIVSVFKIAQAVSIYVYRYKSVHIFAMESFQ